MQAEWGPLRHVRVIKERNSGVSRGFAFVDFPSVVCEIPAVDISFHLDPLLQSKTNFHCRLLELSGR